MTTGKRRSGLGVIFLTVFVDLIGFSIIFPLFPRMLDYYLGTESDGGGLLTRVVASLDEASGLEGQAARFTTQALFGGLLGSMYSVLQFVFAPIWGRLSDRIGRRPVLLVTIAGLAGSYALWFFSGPFWLLVLSRLAGGVMSGNIAVATAAAADVTERRSRASGMGVIGAAFGLGFIVGPAIGGALYYVDLTVPLGSIPGVNPFSAAAAGAFVLSAWNFFWVARRFTETLPPDGRARGNARVGLLDLMRLFRRLNVPGVSHVNLVNFMFLLAFAGMEFTLTFLARDRFGYGPAEITVLFVYSGLIVALVQGGVIRRAAPRFGEKNVALAGLAMVLPGLVAVGLGQRPAVLYIGLGLLSTGSALVMPSLSAIASLMAPVRRQGEILGAIRSLGALSRAIGPVVAGGIYWRFGSKWPYLGGAVVVLGALLLASAIPRARADGSEGDHP